MGGTFKQRMVFWNPYLSLRKPYCSHKRQLAWSTAGMNKPSPVRKESLKKALKKDRNPLKRP